MIKYKIFRKISVTKNDKEIEEMDVSVYCASSSTPQPTETPIPTLTMSELLKIRPTSTPTPTPIIEPVIVKEIKNELTQENKTYSLGSTTLYEVCSHFANPNEIINKIEGQLDGHDFCMSRIFKISSDSLLINLFDGEYWLSNGLYGRKVMKTGNILRFTDNCILCGTEPNTLFV